MNKKPQKNIPAKEVLEHLIQGNARFISGLKSVETLLQVTHMKTLAEMGQNPFCVLITCSDSRIPIEHVFDRGLGDLFVVRSFGTMIDPFVTATVEYAILNFGIEAVILMGHSRSGPVRATMDAEAQLESHISPNFQIVADYIKPSLNLAYQKQNFTGKLSDVERKSPLWEKIYADTCVENIKKGRSELFKNSSIIREQIEKGKLHMIPSLYDVADGRVKFWIPPVLISQLDKKKVVLDANRCGESALEILEDSLEASKTFNEADKPR